MIFELRDHAHQGFLKSYRAQLGSNYIDPHDTMQSAKPYIRRILESSEILRQRIVICFSILFIKFFDIEDERQEVFYFCSRSEHVLSNFFIDDAIDRCFRKIVENIDTFLRNGSGWTILYINFIDIHIGIITRELSGGCAKIQLPTELKKKVYNKYKLQ